MTKISKTLTQELLRSTRIAAEIFKGHWALRDIGPAVTVFGSARFTEGSPHYELARKTGAVLAQAGYAVLTGGGPGVMEAANRGAQEAGGTSVGCNIMLPLEQRQNRFLDKVLHFNYFFSRKSMLMLHSCAFMILPGGFGTLDELTEAMTLILTGKLRKSPVILVGADYWKGFTDWVENVLVKNHAVDRENLAFLHVIDDPKDALKIIANATEFHQTSKKSHKSGKKDV